MRWDKRTTQQRPERWAGLLAVIDIAIVAVLLGQPSFTNASRPVRGIANPLLAMEMARNVTEVDAILSDSPSPDREAMRIKQYTGFAFLGCYAALFIVMSMMLKWRRVIAIGAGASAAIAAMCGMIGNIAILRVVDAGLSHTTQAMIDAVRYPSLVQWVFASLSLGLLGILLLRTPHVGFRIVGALDILGALLGLLGLFDNRLLAWAGCEMLAGLLGLAILCFRPF